MEYNITYGDVVDVSQVVTLDLAKQNSNIEHSDTDEYLQLLLDAAVEDAENYTGTSILKRNVTMEFSGWARAYVLPHYPLQSITSITYQDADGVEQAVDAADFAFYNNAGLHKLLIRYDSFPALYELADFPVKVVGVAGYENDDMPAFVKSAVLMRFSQKEMYREDSPLPTSMDRAFNAALRPLKRW